MICPFCRGMGRRSLMICYEVSAYEFDFEQLEAIVPSSVQAWCWECFGTGRHMIRRWFIREGKWTKGVYL